MSSPFRRRGKLLDPAGEEAVYEHAQRRARIIGRIIVAFCAVIVLAGAGVGAAYNKIINKVNFQPSLSTVLPEASRPPKVTTNVAGNPASSGTAQNILILGVDNRLGENATYQVKSGPKQTEDLSDTTILAHLSADGKHVTLVSIPRDSVVEIPACAKVDANGNKVLDANGQPEYSKPVKALFNSAIELGGPYCSAETLENLTGVRIDNYLEIDFTGVVKMSQALGGVPLTMCEPIHDANTGLNLPAGPVNLEGAQALAFVRARYGLTGGDDLHRIERQQQFMASMVRKALHSASFFDPTKMFSFYSAVAGSLTTDMQSSALINLALRYRHIDTSNIVFVTVPTYPAPKGDPFYEHLYWSTDEAKALFADIHDDRPLPTATSGGAAVAQITVPRSSISLRVLNGTNTNNLAHEVADELVAQGFRVAAIGTADQVPTAKTTLTYEASRTNSMQTVAGALVSAPQEVEDASTGTSITLTIGTDWAGLTAPSTSPSASPSASASAGASVAPPASATASLNATDATTAKCVPG
jgi:LCP family protein required for cell wall assembly